LVGFYDQWSDTTRHYFIDRYLTLLNTLAVFHKKNGEFEQALMVFRKIVQKDPLDEKGHRGVLEMLQTLDRFKDAQQHYRHLRETMHQETGIDLPQTLVEYLTTRE